MPWNKQVTTLIALIIVGSAGTAIAQGKLSEQLSPLAPLIGKTWKGQFAGSTPKKPMFDVSRWERTLNGQAVRVLHSANDGEYGGETIIMWDPSEKSLVFHYFTTAGFFTRGTMTVKNGKIVNDEYVTGNKNSITEVKPTAEPLPDGCLHAKAQYLKIGTLVDGQEVTYAEDPSALVVFKEPI